MKKLMFLLLVGFTIIPCKAQVKYRYDVKRGFNIPINEAYVPFSEFQSDTLRYAKVNFEENKFYTSKSFAKPLWMLIDDLEIPFDSMPMGDQVARKDSTGNLATETDIIGIALNLTPNRYNTQGSKMMYVFFEERMYYKDYRILRDKLMKEKGIIKEQVFDWYPVNSEIFSNFTVKDVSVGEIPID